MKHSEEYYREWIKRNTGKIVRAPHSFGDRPYYYPMIITGQGQDLDTFNSKSVLPGIKYNDDHSIWRIDYEGWIWSEEE